MAMIVLPAARKCKREVSPAPSGTTVFALPGHVPPTIPMYSWRDIVGSCREPPPPYGDEGIRTPDIRVANAALSR
jgi:hypothetical protein